MPLPLTVSCFSKIQTGFTFLVPAHLGSPGKRAIKRMCVCVLTNKNKKHLLLIVNYKIVKTWKLSISPSNLQELTTREEGLWHHSGWRDMADYQPWQAAWWWSKNFPSKKVDISLLICQHLHWQQATTPHNVRWSQMRYDNKHCDQV